MEGKRVLAYRRIWCMPYCT